jgi:sporulation protein YlmC with PRC-barrel domain
MSANQTAIGRMKQGKTTPHVLVAPMIYLPAIYLFLALANGQPAKAQPLGAAHASTAHRFAQAQAAPPESLAPTPPAASPSPSPATSPPAQSTDKANIAQPPEAPTASAGIPAVVIDGQQAESILGKKIRSSSGEDMGRVVDVIVDKSGQIRAAIIDFGGFLGVGSRQIAVDWKTIRFPSDPKSEALAVDLTRDQLRVAPVYKAGEQIVVLGRPRAEPAATAPQANAGSPPSSVATDSPQR